MIVVKTKMKWMPKSCTECIYCQGIGNGLKYSRVCNAIAAYIGHGKPINPSWDERRINISKERPEWCPLEDQFAESDIGNVSTEEFKRTHG